MRKDELIDVVITSHWDSNSRNSPTIVRIDERKISCISWGKTIRVKAIS